ncbi:MAG: hypothetical protein WCR72_04880 [Bacteroidota bacterium]
MKFIDFLVAQGSSGRRTYTTASGTDFYKTELSVVLKEKFLSSTSFQSQNPVENYWPELSSNLSTDLAESRALVSNFFFSLPGPGNKTWNAFWQIAVRMGSLIRQYKIIKAASC